MIEGHGSKEFAAVRGLAYRRSGVVRRADPGRCWWSRPSAYLLRHDRRPGAEHGHVVRFLGRRADRRTIPPLRNRTDPAASSPAHPRGPSRLSRVIGFPALGRVACSANTPRERSGVQPLEMDTGAMDPLHAAAATVPATDGRAGQSRSVGASSRAVEALVHRGIQTVLAGMAWPSRLSSTSATASCRRRRRSMWRQLDGGPDPACLTEL